MDRKTEHIVRLRAAGFCEYCRLPESVSLLPFPIDHVIARQHGGRTVVENLAVACPDCHLHKGPNIAGLDPVTGELTPLFNPRRDRWEVHFEWRNASLVGLTPIGRATVQVLASNDAARVALRELLVLDGTFPGAPPTRDASESDQNL